MGGGGGGGGGGVVLPAAAVERCGGLAWRSVASPLAPSPCCQLL